MFEIIEEAAEFSQPSEVIFFLFLCLFLTWIQTKLPDTLKAKNTIAKVTKINTEVAEKNIASKTTTIPTPLLMSINLF